MGVALRVMTLVLAGVFAYPVLQLVARALGLGAGVGGQSGFSDRGGRVGGGVTLEHVGAVLSSGGFFRAAGTSIVLGAAVAVVSTVLASLAGFALARYRFRGRGVYVVGLVGLAALPGQLLLPGGFEVVAGLGLFDTHLAVVLPASVSVFGVLLYRAAFGETPEELLAAGRIDGCSEVGVWWLIALPSVRPTTAACLCLSFVGSYNAVVWPMVVLQSPGLETLPMHLALMSGGAITEREQARVAAGTVLSMVPLVVIFLALQRDFLPTLRGAIKG